MLDGFRAPNLGLKEAPTKLDHANTQLSLLRKTHRPDAKSLPVLPRSDSASGRCENFVHHGRQKIYAPRIFVRAARGNYLFFRGRIQRHESAGPDSSRGDSVSRSTSVCGRSGSGALRIVFVHPRLTADRKTRTLKAEGCGTLNSALANVWPSRIDSLRHEQTFASHTFKNCNFWSGRNSRARGNFFALFLGTGNSCNAAQRTNQAVGFALVLQRYSA